MTFCPECGEKMDDRLIGGDLKFGSKSDRPRYHCLKDKITWEWFNGTYTLIDGEIP